MHGLSQLLTHHHGESKAISSSSTSSSSSSGLSSDDNPIVKCGRRVSRGSVSSTYSYGPSGGGSHGSSSHDSSLSNHGALFKSHKTSNHSIYHTIHGFAQHHHHTRHSSQQQQQQSNNQHHLHQNIHFTYGKGGSSPSPTSPSPTGGESDQKPPHHHHHHSIQEMIKHFGRRLGHIRRQSECNETPKKKGDDFRNRSQSLDGSTRYHTILDADCETTYRIYDSILRQGNFAS